jgi:hypothetical protein
MENLTVQAAESPLSANPDAYATKEALLGLLKQLDVHAEGAVTVFYSGPVQGVSSGKVVEALLDQGADIRAIDKTQAFEFMDSRAFKDAVGKVFGLGYEDFTSETPLLDPVKESAQLEAKAWLGKDPVHSPWAVISIMQPGKPFWVC